MRSQAVLIAVLATLVAAVAAAPRVKRADTDEIAFELSPVAAVAQVSFVCFALGTLSWEIVQHKCERTRLARVCACELLFFARLLMLMCVLMVKPIHAAWLCINVFARDLLHRFLAVRPFPSECIFAGTDAMLGELASRHVTSTHPRGRRNVAPSDRH